MLHSIAHESCHFEEACAFELPSRANISSHSLLRPSCESEIKTNGKSTKGKGEDPIISSWGGVASTTTQFRFSTEHHALTLAVRHKEGNAYMAKSFLPKIVKNGINSKETRCISHSFLPVDEINRNRTDDLKSRDKSSYIESFLMCTNSPDGDGNIDVAKSSHTYATSASFSSDLRKDLTPSSSYGTLAPLEEFSIKKRDDVASSSVSFFDRSIGTVKDEYFLVVKGYLPDLDDPLTTIMDRSVGYAAAEKSDAPREETMSNSAERKKSDDHPFTASKRKKWSKCDDSLICTNFSQVFPLSYQPSLIEMSQGDELSEFIIFVADDTKVNIYSLVLNSLSESERAKNNKFELKKCILAREDEGQEGVEQNQNRAFMAMLIQESHDIESDILSFPSPITALCHTVKESMHYLSVSSQNGTVRIITFTAPEGKHQWSGFKQDNYGGISSASQVESNRYFAVKTISEFTIDGPVLCLAYSKHNQHGDNDCPKVLCGSMRGFACYFCPSSATKSGFDGPFSITEGLWNPNLCEEDGVMSICEFSYGGAHDGSLICLGLFSGRVVCYTPGSSGKGELLNELALDPSMHQRLGLDSLNSLPTFHPVWSYSLPLPIHSIGVANCGLFSDIVVCTGRTLHLFHSTTERIAESTLERLDALLHKYSNGNYSDDRLRSNNSESKIQSIVSL